MDIVNDYYQLVEGTKRGPMAFCARTVLSALACGYHIPVNLRNMLYSTGLKSSYKAPCPVISVGNITLGGTGKTPAVAWLAKQLLRQGHHPGFVSRGYGARNSDGVLPDGKKIVNDEAIELAQYFYKVPHFQDRIRRRAIEQLLKEAPETDVILMDDGFQHRQVQRSLDVVLLDAICPFGFMRLFPRGFLREPISALRRADFIVITRADIVATEELAQIQYDLYKLVPRTPVALSCHIPLAVYTNHIPRVPYIDWYRTNRHRRFAAFCGIGNPAGFHGTLKSSGLDIAAFHAFPDHYSYKKEGIARELDWFAEQNDVECLITTMKDWVKLSRVRTKTPIVALEVGLKFLTGENELLQAVKNVFPNVTDSGKTEKQSLKQSLK